MSPVARPSMTQARPRRPSTSARSRCSRFAYSNPIVLAGAGAGVVVAGLAAGAGRALRASARWGLTLGIFIVAVNGLVAQRGDTVLVHGLWLPLLGSTDVSAEALAEGGVLALRIVVVLMAFAVHSACVDPDRVLRLLRPMARHSALTATLIARLVPLAAADHARLGEAAVLRGPAAAPVGRAALARRLVAGSLDRAVDVAATLELRGYAHGPAGLGAWRSSLAPRRPFPGRRARHRRRRPRGAGGRGGGVRPLSDREHRHRLADPGAGRLRSAGRGAPVRDGGPEAGRRRR